jgi:hypothetical protein
MDTQRVIPYSVWCIFRVLFFKTGLTIKTIHFIKTQKGSRFYEEPSCISVYKNCLAKIYD